MPVQLSLLLPSGEEEWRGEGRDGRSGEGERGGEEAGRVTTRARVVSSVEMGRWKALLINYDHRCTIGRGRAGGRGPESRGDYEEMDTNQAEGRGNASRRGRGE